MTDFSTQLANSENLGSLNSQSWESRLKTFSLTSKSQWNWSPFKIHWNGVSKTQIYLVVSYRLWSLWSLDLRLPTQVQERRQGGLGFEWFQLESMVFNWVLLHHGRHKSDFYGDPGDQTAGLTRRLWDPVSLREICLREHRWDGQDQSAGLPQPTNTPSLGIQQMTHGFLNLLQTSRGGTHVSVPRGANPTKER